MTQPTEQDTVWLTQEAYDKLHGRARGPQGPRRARRSSPGSAPPATRATSRRTAATTPPARSRASSRAGSASSRTCCARAEVGETPADDGVVEPGMVVTYKFVGDDDEPRRSCSAPARSRPTTALTVYSPAVPARRGASSAPSKGDTVELRRRPTARTSRSRSSTRCPTRADRSAGRASTRRLLDDPVAALAEPGRAPARRAARRGSPAAGCTSTSSRCSARRDPLVHDLEHVGAARRRRSASSWARPPGRSGMRTRRLR